MKYVWKEGLVYDDLSLQMKYIEICVEREMFFFKKNSINLPRVFSI